MSAASSGSCSNLPSAERYSTIKLCPPDSQAHEGRLGMLRCVPRLPQVSCRSVFRCVAFSLAAAPLPYSRKRTAKPLILKPSGMSMRVVGLALPGRAVLIEYFIRSRQHVRRNREADLLLKVVIIHAVHHETFSVKQMTWVFSLLRAQREAPQ